MSRLRPAIPDLLTPGAAEALSVKIYRSLKTGASTPEAALDVALRDYQPPVPPAVIQAQIALAVAEATDLSFVPERFREGPHDNGRCVESSSEHQRHEEAVNDRVLFG